MAYPETFDAIRLGCGADSTLAATRLFFVKQRGYYSQLDGETKGVHGKSVQSKDN